MTYYTPYSAIHQMGRAIGQSAGMTKRAVGGEYAEIVRRRQRLLMIDVFMTHDTLRALGREMTRNAVRVRRPVPAAAVRLRFRILMALHA